MIVFLSAMSLRRFERFEEIIVEKQLPKIEIPEVKLPEFDLDKLDLKDFDLKHWRRKLTTEQPEENYQTFVSPDKTLKMKYPTNWQEIDKAFLEKINQQIKEFGLEEINILLFAHQIRLVEYPPVLMVLSLPSEKGLAETLEEIERIAQEQQMEMEVIKTGTKNNKDYFKVKSKKENQVFISKGEIIFTEEKNYLIIVLALENILQEIAPEIDFIFASSTKTFDSP